MKKHKVSSLIRPHPKCQLARGLKYNKYTDKKKAYLFLSFLKKKLKYNKYTDKKKCKEAYSFLFLKKGKQRLKPYLIFIWVAVALKS
jgi:hypothetical protein